MGKTGQNFTHWKGNFRRPKFVVEDVPNLTNCTAEWGFANNKTDPFIVKKTSTSNPAQITFSGTIVTVILLPVDTDDASNIPPGDYYHELRIVDSEGNPSTPATGTMKLEPVILK